MNVSIRPATLADIALMMRMVEHSRGVMRRNGNTVQWTGYPTDDDLRADVTAGVAHIIMQDDTPAGMFSLVPGDEPTYAVISHGRWISPTLPYSTVHRLAALEGTHGIAQAAFSYATSRCDYLRADTHENNHIVRHLLTRRGFVPVGTVMMTDNTPRIAYEWWGYGEVTPSLKAFVERDVVPRYALFDTAHREEHCRRVIARAMEMRRTGSPAVRQLAADKVYAAAAMHDIGLAHGREEHHLHSGVLVRACKPLRQWFSPADIEEIACAAEDHRASATRPPRSLLGCVVAEADRDVEPETIVRRTVEYGLSHYPHLDREGHFRRMCDHLEEKYSARGYITLWLDDSPNLAPLQELRTLIADRARLAALFDSLYQPLVSRTNP